MLIESITFKLSTAIYNSFGRFISKFPLRYLPIVLNRVNLTSDMGKYKNSELKKSPKAFTLSGIQYNYQFFSEY